MQTYFDFTIVFSVALGCIIARLFISFISFVIASLIKIFIDKH